jgi:hypothetical protein
MMPASERKRRFRSRFAALQHDAPCIPGRTQPYAAHRRLGREIPAFSTNETGCVCFPSFRLNGKVAEKPRGMMPAGTTAQPSGRYRPPALSFHIKFFDGRLRPAASMFAAKAA